MNMKICYNSHSKPKHNLGKYHIEGIPGLARLPKLSTTINGYLGFLSQTFSNHRTAGEGEGHFFNSSIPLPPASQTLRH